MSVLRAVAEHALAEAVECETRATKLETEAGALRREAAVLRDLHAIAEPHVAKPGRLEPDAGGDIRP